MKRTPLKRFGRKTREWLSERKKRVDELRNNPNYKIEGSVVYGNCKDCLHWHKVDPDHLIKRGNGGSHDKDNLDWICNEYPCFCHDKRDNRGDPINKKPKSKKPEWSKEHACKKCKQKTSFLLCNHCGKISI